MSVPAPFCSASTAGESGEIRRRPSTIVTARSSASSSNSSEPTPSCSFGLGAAVGARTVNVRLGLVFFPDDDAFVSFLYGALEFVYEQP